MALHVDSMELAVKRDEPEDDEDELDDEDADLVDRAIVVTAGFAVLGQGWLRSLGS